ncbi:hypothetical protein [Pelobacter seleniigenes]|uniref:hypothetical protein n=1 Tax=Pelobacter seleniigenes TaxID=407188 RepID=UPI0004A766F0|nr:hypothetical protein [Pelobacter seleniigenes]
MKHFLLFRLFRANTLGQLAAEHSLICAGFINAVTGSLLLVTILSPLLSLFTPALTFLLVILFGPLLGFLISSFYSRVEYVLGKLFSGKAALEQLYRLYAWSLLPFALVCFITIFALQRFSSPDNFRFAMTGGGIFLFLAGLVSLRNYGINLRAVQNFSVIRGIGCQFSSLLTALLLMGGLAWLLYFMLGTVPDNSYLGLCLNGYFHR